MESHWQKMNPVLYQKIVQYDRSKNQTPYLILQYEQQNKHLFKTIQEKFHQSNYVFPRKIHQSHKICQKEDHNLALQLSQKTYNLYQQNPNLARSRISRQKRNSFKSLNRHLSNNSFVVRKTNGSKSSKDDQKRNLQSYQVTTANNSSGVHRFLKNVAMSPIKLNQNKKIEKQQAKNQQCILSQVNKIKGLQKLSQRKQRLSNDSPLTKKSLQRSFYIQKQKQKQNKQKSRFCQQRFYNKRVKTEIQNCVLPTI